MTCQWRDDFPVGELLVLTYWECFENNIFFTASRVKHDNRRVILMLRFTADLGLKTILRHVSTQNIIENFNFITGVTGRIRIKSVSMKLSS